jgi:hypothetical protein
VGIIPSSSGTIIRHGNTSLEMAADLAAGTEPLETLQRIADEVEHVAFSGSRIFSEHFIRELAYWCEGPPRHRMMPVYPDPVIVQSPPKWIAESTKFTRPNYRLPIPVGTDRCELILQTCPNKALTIVDNGIEIDLRVCEGSSCLQCHRAGLLFGSPVS